MKNIIILIGFFLIAFNKCNSQEFNEKSTIWDDFKYDMGNVLKGVGYTYSRPFHWKSNDLLKLSVVSASTFGIYTFDDEIRSEFLNHKSKVPNVLLDYGWYAGSPQNNYGVTGGVYLLGLFTKNQKLRRTGVLLITSATSAGFIQQLSKSLVGRARPDTNFGKNHFRPFGGSAGYRSFPSGHSVLTFTNAHAIAKQFKSWYVKAPIYALGLIPGVSRIYEDKHWASDVFLSWVLSYFIVEAVDIYLDKKYESKYNDKQEVNSFSRKKIELNILVNGGGLGLGLSF